MLPVVTGTVTVVIVSPLAVGEPDVNQSGSAMAAATTTTAPAPMGHRYRRHTDGGSGGSTFSSSSGNSSVRLVGLSGASIAPALAMLPVQTRYFTTSPASAVSPLGVLRKRRRKAQAKP